MWAKQQRKPHTIPPAIYVTCIGFLILNIVMNPNILSARGIGNLCMQFAPTILAVMAQALVMLIEELDVSIGALIGFVTVVLALTMETLGMLSILLVIAMVAVFSLITGWVVARFKISCIVVTIATSMIYQGLALLLMPTPGGVIDRSFAKAVTNVYGIIPGSLILLIAVLVFWAYIRSTRLGLAIYATGGNQQSAYASGIQVNRVKIMAFMISGLFCALSGIVLAARTNSGDANIALDYSITSIAGAVLGGVSFAGGVGVMYRAVAGAIVLGVLTNILFFFQVGSFWQYVFQGVILLVAVIMSRLESGAALSRRSAS